MRAFHALNFVLGAAIVAGGVAFTPLAQAQMYRCKNAAGSTVVQDTPCADSTAAAKAAASGGLDVLSPRQCAWWSNTVSQAAQLNNCLLIFQQTDDGFTVDNAQISLGGKPVHLQLFDSRVQETELVPGLPVIGSESYSYASPDKAVQIFLRAVLVPRKNNEDEGGYNYDRLRYQGKLTVKTGDGEKTISIAYDRPQEVYRSSAGHRRTAAKRRG